MRARHPWWGRQPAGPHPHHPLPLAHALEAAVDSAVTAWLLAQLGTTTSTADLVTRYARLGTARAVAIEVLYERKAALLQQPASVSVSSVVAVTFTENIKALERQIALLESGDPPAPDDPTDTDSSSTETTLGLFFLRERPRR